jgi:hypothetical protein
MKNKLYGIAGLLSTLLVTFSATGQSGIYMDTAAFKNGKLAYEGECGGGRKNKNVHVHDFFWNSSYITVKSGGIKHKLKKSDVFGFRNCVGDLYRFYKNEAYRIAEAGGIYIYSQAQNVTQNKGFKIARVYYFSRSPGSDILPLTCGNLENAYHDNEKFLDKLGRFPCGSKPDEYDTVHNTFKVNYLYSRSTR